MASASPRELGGHEDRDDEIIEGDHEISRSSLRERRLGQASDAITADGAPPARPDLALADDRNAARNLLAPRSRRRRRRMRETATLGEPARA